MSSDQESKLTITPNHCSKEWLRREVSSNSGGIKKKTKIQAFDALISEISENIVCPSDDLIGALRALVPSTRLKQGDYWTHLMNFTTKNDVRWYLNFIYVVDNKVITASNGHALLRVEVDHELESGKLYECNRNKVMSDRADFKYPSLRENYMEGKEEIDLPDFNLLIYNANKK